MNKNKVCLTVYKDIVKEIKWYRWYFYGSFCILLQKKLFI